MDIATLLASFLSILTAAAGAIHRCKPPAIPHNARVLVDGKSVSDAPRSQRYHKGTTAEVICDEGYEVIGNPLITCSGRGFWQGEQPSCAINVALGKIAYQSSTVSEGNAANALNGSCSQTDREFSPWWKVDLMEPYAVIALKVRSTLSRHSKLQHLEIRVGNSTTHGQNALCKRFPGPMGYGETQIFRCSIPLTGRYVFITMDRVRESLSLCNVQVFSSGVPREAPLGCGSPDSNENSVIRGSNFTVGATIEYQCPTGYAIIGPHTRTCTHSGEWTNAAPRCQHIDCGQLDNPDYGSVVLVDQRTTFSATAQYSCDEDHSMDGSPLRTCTVNGTWEPREPKCPANRCQPLPPFEGGTFNVTGLKAGDSAIYSCNPAHKLVGDKVLKCESGGQWSSAPPRCVVVDCGMLSEVTNGRIELLNGSTTLSSVAVYSCAENYKLNSTNTTICQENGSWSGIPPNCALIDCQTPPDVRNGNVSLVNGTTTFGSRAVYLCDSGFTPQDVFIRVCTASGEWSGSVPDCAPEIKGSWFWTIAGFCSGVSAVISVLVLARMWKRKQWRGPCYGLIPASAGTHFSLSHPLCRSGLEQRKQMTNAVCYNI